MACVGVLGGSFNPVHLGHLILAQDALDRFDLDRVLFVPCAQPPHKPAAELAPAEHRVAMLEAALQGAPRFELCDIEVRRGGTTYTIDTLRALARARARDELAFIIGADTLPELRLWKEAPALLREFRFVTLARPGFALDAAAARSLALAPDIARRLQADLAQGHGIGISATDIRHRVAEGMSIRYLVPDAVEAYIREHGLYRRA